MGNVLVDSNTIPFGRRGLAPRVCIVDGKEHIRTFLADMLEELGFVAAHCGSLAELRTALTGPIMNLFVVGSLAGEEGQTGALLMLASAHCKARVMVFGGRSSLALLAAQGLGERLGLAMLPPLGTPFRERDLTENLSPFLPIPAPPSLPIDVEEALRRDWLELWYQPKIDLHDLKLRGAEALVRVRHPFLGIVLPGLFVPALADAPMRTLSRFAVARAMAEWPDFAAVGTPVELAVNLPLRLLADPDFIEHARAHMPNDRRFTRLIVDVKSAEIFADLASAHAVARRLMPYNIAISIDDVGVEAALLSTAGGCPFAELKVDWRALEGRGDDDRRAICRPVVEAAARLGVRAAATGIETAADFHAVRTIGFDLVQGNLFAKPMDPRKFARTVLRRRGIALV